MYCIGLSKSSRTFLYPYSETSFHPSVYTIQWLPKLSNKQAKLFVLFLLQKIDELQWYNFCHIIASSLQCVHKIFQVNPSIFRDFIDDPIQVCHFSFFQNYPTSYFNASLYIHIHTNSFFATYYLKEQIVFYTVTNFYSNIFQLLVKKQRCHAPTVKISQRQGIADYFFSVMFNQIQYFIFHLKEHTKLYRIIYSDEYSM